MIGLSLPNDCFWVNLRPDSPDDIIDPLLAQTDVGKILLEADLQLKKDTARFTSPETLEGREYWNKLYQKAGEIFGGQNITIPTLTRPWIVPDEIIIRETTDSAYVYKATLKVMLEEDYLQKTGNRRQKTDYSFKDSRLAELNTYSSQLIRENIIPKLSKEINTSKRYATLRQVYYSLILASWFKARKQGLRNQGLSPQAHGANQGLSPMEHLSPSLRATEGSEAISNLIDSRNLSNLTSAKFWSTDTYFNAYKENFAKGEYNIQEPAYNPYGQTIRSYFSGGISGLAPEIAPLGAAPAGNAIAIAAAGEGVPLGGSLVSQEASVDLGTGEVKIEPPDEFPNLAEKRRGQGGFALVWPWQESNDVANGEPRTPSHIPKIMSFIEKVRKLDKEGTIDTPPFIMPTGKIRDNQILLKKFKQELTRLQNTGGVYLGISGWINLEIIDVRNPDVIILADYNRAQVIAFQCIRDSILSSRDRHDFTRRCMALLEERLPQYCGEQGRYHHSFTDKLLINKLLTNEGSWLFTEASFERMKLRFIEGRVIIVNLDITDKETFKKLGNFLDEEGLILDSIYISNIFEWVEREAKSIQAVSSNIATISGDETLLISEEDSISDVSIAKVREDLRTRVSYEMAHSGTPRKYSDTKLSIKPGDEATGQIHPARVANILQGLFTAQRDGTTAIYVNRDEIDSHLADFEDILGAANTTRDRVLRYLDGHETLHALINHLRKNKGKPMEEITPDEEERLAMRFGRAFALYDGNLYSDRDLVDEIHAIEQALDELLLEPMEDALDDPAHLDTLLKYLGVSVDIKETKTSQELEEIKARVDAGGGAYKEARYISQQERWVSIQRQLESQLPAAQELDPKSVLMPLLVMRWGAGLSELDPRIKESMESMFNKRPESLRILLDEIQKNSLAVPADVMNWLLGLPEALPIKSEFPQQQDRSGRARGTETSPRNEDMPTIGSEDIIAQLNDRKEKVIAMGCEHAREDQSSFAAQVTDNLKGLTHVFLEISVIHQADVNKYLETGEITDALSGYMNGTEKYEKILIAAKKRGIRVIAADNRWQIEGGTLWWPGDYLAAEIVRNEIEQWETKNGTPAKALVYFGAKHIAASQLPGTRESGYPTACNSMGRFLKYKLGAYLINVNFNSWIAKGSTPSNGVEDYVLRKGLERRVVGILNLPYSLLANEGDERDRPYCLLGEAFDAVVYAGEGIQEMEAVRARADAEGGEVREARPNSIEIDENVRLLAERKILASPGLFFFDGGCLYRALTQAEWSQLRNSGYLTVAEGTLFEKQIGPQVLYHMKADGYSGIVARVPGKAFHFSTAGARDPQASCLLAHNINVSEIKISEKGDVNNLVSLAELFGYENNVLPPPLQKNSPFSTGGIDLRTLPIVIQAIGNLRMTMDMQAISRLYGVDVSSELEDIQRTVDAGISPSAERIKDYVRASSVQGNLDIDRVVACISDILRREEESCCSTDPLLRDILVVLESGNNQQVKEVFAGKI